jgi:hypothetical protein
MSVVPSVPFFSGKSQTRHPDGLDPLNGDLPDADDIAPARIKTPDW